MIYVGNTSRNITFCVNNITFCDAAISTILRFFRTSKNFISLTIPYVDSVKIFVCVCVSFCSCCDDNQVARVVAQII